MNLVFTIDLFFIYLIGVCEAIVASDGLEHLIELLNNSNIILQGIAAVTIDCLVRDSAEGQRRLLRQ
jgi:hypothetical protein